MLRLSALALLAVAIVPAAVARADAPASGVTPPAGWRELPAIAAALREGAAADGVTVEATEAWGDPARGCFATWLALRGTGAATAEQIVASLAGTTVSRVAAAPGRVTLAFDRAPFHGRLSATIDGAAVRALACFGDGRAPLACDEACATWIPEGPRG